MLEVVAQRGLPQDVLEHIRNVHDISAAWGRSIDAAARGRLGGS